MCSKNKHSSFKHWLRDRMAIDGGAPSVSPFYRKRVVYMFWLIASIIVFLILFALLGVDRREGKWHLRPQQFASLGAFVLMGFSMVAIVPANSVGIVYSPFTGVSEKTLAEGWHTYDIPGSGEEVGTKKMGQLIREHL